MKRKFSIMGLVSVVFWAISIGSFLSTVWSLFVVVGSNLPGYYKDDYSISLILFFITNPKVWEFVKNKIFK